MTTPETKYAFDLSNDGVSLWHRDSGRAWKLLGKVGLSAENFSDDIEKLKAGYTPNADGKFIAQVHIPNSEVFASDINLNGAKGDKIIETVNAFLIRNTPYAADDLIFDLANKPNEDMAYVAAISKETIEEARDFITSYGFIAAYYTTKLDKADFPRNPRFYDADNPVSIPSDPPAPRTAPLPLNPVSTSKTVPETAPVASKKAPDNAIPPPVKATTGPQGKNPQIVKNKTDLSSFKTVRGKTKMAQDKSATKAILPTLPSQAPRRISIEVSAPEKNTETAKTARVIAPIKMPQSTTIKTDMRGMFRPRHILLLATLILLGLMYWFYNMLIDGKDEITLLQQIPDTPPAIITTPQELTQKPSVDKIPFIGNNPVASSSQGPVTKPAIKLFTPDSVIIAGPIAPYTPAANPKDQAAVNPDIAAPSMSDQTMQSSITTALVTKPLPKAADAEIPAIKEDTLAPLVPTKEVTSAPLIPTKEVALASLVPTKEGTPGPEGITLILGQPDFIPPDREQLKISQDPLKNVLPKMRSKEFEENNKSEAIIAPSPQITPKGAIKEESAQNDNAQLQPTALPTEELATPDLLALANPALKNKVPEPRPASLSRQVQDLQNSLLARADSALASSKPKARPTNLNIPAPDTDIEIVIQQAVNETARPRARPKSLKSTIAKAKASGADIQTASTGNGASLSSNPSPVNIQKEATERSRFNKKRISLVGVYGTTSNRRALVRMPSGRYVKVKPGQKFAGWKVAAIGESSVRITKGSRNQVLRMPK